MGSLKDDRSASALPTTSRHSYARCEDINADQIALDGIGEKVRQRGLDQVHLVFACKVQKDTGVALLDHLWGSNRIAMAQCQVESLDVFEEQDDRGLVTRCRLAAREG